MPTEPPDCPCFTALCQIHTKEGNCPRQWHVHAFPPIFLVDGCNPTQPSLSPNGSWSQWPPPPPNPHMSWSTAQARGTTGVLKKFRNASTGLRRPWLLSTGGPPLFSNPVDGAGHWSPQMDLIAGHSVGLWRPKCKFAGGPPLFVLNPLDGAGCWRLQLDLAAGQRVWLWRPKSKITGRAPFFFHSMWTGQGCGAHKDFEINVGPDEKHVHKAHNSQPTTRVSVAL